MSPLFFQRRPVELAIRERLLDRALESYLDWRAESDAVGEAFGHWSAAPAAEGADRFAAYRAALDREECAATLYSAVIERLERLPGADIGLAASEAGAQGP